MKKAVFAIILFVFGFSALAQEPEKDLPFGTEGQYTFETERPYKLLELDQKTDEPIVTQKKKPRNLPSPPTHALRDSQNSTLQ